MTIQLKILCDNICTMVDFVSKAENDSQTFSPFFKVRS